MSAISPQELDYKNVRTKGPEFYERYREEILSGWLGLFQDMGYAYKLQGNGVAKIMMQL